MRACVSTCMCGGAGIDPLYSGSEEKFSNTLVLSHNYCIFMKSLLCAQSLLHVWCSTGGLMYL